MHKISNKISAVEFGLSEAEGLIFNTLKFDSYTSRKVLRNSLKKLNYGQTDNALNQIIYGLRAKLSKSKCKLSIRTHKNMGYSLQKKS